MNPESIKESIINAILVFFVAIGVLTLLASIFKKCTGNKENTSSPVEETRIDLIKKENEILILEVNNLDSIKNVKTIEVKSLDNDSTLKLFYELIRK